MFIYFFCYSVLLINDCRLLECYIHSQYILVPIQIYVEPLSVDKVTYATIPLRSHQSVSCINSCLYRCDPLQKI